MIFPGALGDFICFLPALCGLRERYAGHLRIVAQPALSELVRLPDTSAVSIDRREVADLFASTPPLRPDTRRLFGGFVAVHSWTGFNVPGFTERLGAATGGDVAVHRFRGMRPGEHAADYYARCIGMPPQSSPPGRVATDAQWLRTFRRQHGLHTRKFLVIHPGSGSPAKNWQGLAAFIARWRIRHGEPIVVLYGPADTAPPLSTLRQAQGERNNPMKSGRGTAHAEPVEAWGGVFQHPAREADVLPLTGLSLPQVAALLRDSRLYLGNDSGVSHLAGAVGARGVVLFGPSDPAIWGPRGGALRIVHAPHPCTRCGANIFCVHRLPVERVSGALEACADGKDPNFPPEQGSA